MPLRIARSTRAGRTARWVPALSELIPVPVRHHRGLEGLGVNRTAQCALLAVIEQVNANFRLLCSKRFGVYTESLVVSRQPCGHSSLLAAEGLQPALQETVTSVSPRPIYLDLLPQIHLLRKKSFPFLHSFGTSERWIPSIGVLATFYCDCRLSVQIMP